MLSHCPSIIYWEGRLFSPVTWDAIFIVAYIFIYIWVYFWTCILCQQFLSIYAPIPQCFNHRLCRMFNLLGSVLSMWVFFFRAFLAILLCLLFPREFRINLSSSRRNVFLLGTNLGKIRILLNATANSHSLLYYPRMRGAVPFTCLLWNFSISIIFLFFSISIILIN